MSEKAPWVNFRPQIKVLDCTVRDGGLINSHRFEDGFVKGVYDACVSGGIDIMEIGYKADSKIFSADKNGPWKFSKEDDIRRVIGDNDTDLKISVMADAEKTDYHNDILPKKDSVIDVIRVATYISQVPVAMDMVKDFVQKGYEVHVNLMALSVVQDKELAEALEIFAASEIKAMAIVDSFGTFLPLQIRDYAKRFLSAAEGTDKEIAIHAHNNRQLAFANTIEALSAGVNYLDATMMGMGRGAGNCPMELLISLLRNPKFNLRSILECVETQMLPMRKEYEWGALVPYNITGHFNEHPRSAIGMRESTDKDRFLKFYDQHNES